MVIPFMELDDYHLDGRFLPLWYNAHLLAFSNPLLKWSPRWQYIDDILMASTDRFFVQFVLLYAQHPPTSSGLIVSKKNHRSFPHNALFGWERKYPATASVICLPPWPMHSSTFGSYDTRGSPVVDCFAVWDMYSGYCVATPPTLLGIFLPLAAAPSPACSSPRNLWRSLVTAWFGTTSALHQRPLPPLLTMSITYCDAAPGPIFSYMVAAYKRNTFAAAAIAPSWVRYQQSAELYAVFHTIRQLILRKSTHACIAVDNAASYFTISTGRISLRCHDHIRILRRINRLCLESKFQFELILVHSEANAADPFSRFLNVGKIIVPIKVWSISNKLKFTRCTSAITRFWWVPFY